jgi:hypothetical protein
MAGAKGIVDKLELKTGNDHHGSTIHWLIAADE